MGPFPARVWLALLAVQVSFGSLSVALKFAFRDIAPAAVAAIRVASAAVILVALERALVPRERPRPGARDVAAFLGFAVLGVTLNQFLFIEGLARTTAINATLLVSTIPPFTLLVALVLGRESFNARRAVGVGVSIAGVALLVGLDALALGGRYLLGNLFIVTNAFLYSVYLVVSRPSLHRFDPLTVVAWTFALGALLMLLLGGPALARTDFAAVGAVAWLGLAWVVLVGTVVTYTLNNWVLQFMDSSLVAAAIPLQPLVAALLSVPLLHETVTWRTAVAGGIILVGVVVSARASRSRRAGKPI